MRVQELAEGEVASLLEVRDLNVAYGKVDALHGATLRVNAGQIVTVIGPNAAGKTTMLAAIMGQLGCSGEVNFLGRSQAGVKVERRSLTPAFAPEVDGVAEAFARRMAGDNGPGRVVPYAAEAGQFQGAGFSTVICGPGSIDQAHQPDEFVEISQMQRGAAFMVRLVEELSA